MGNMDKKGAVSTQKGDFLLELTRKGDKKDLQRWDFAILAVGGLFELLWGSIKAVF